MYDIAVIWEWIAFSVRWLHVVTAMAWIGASFYFIALDLMLKPAVITRRRLGRRMGSPRRRVLSHRKIYGCPLCHAGASDMA